MSSLWKHLPSIADELCMVHSLCETNVAHGACMKMHTGTKTTSSQYGSWVSYGLGSETKPARLHYDLPYFMVA